MIVLGAAYGIQTATQQGISPFLPSRCTPLLLFNALRMSFSLYCGSGHIKLVAIVHKFHFHLVSQRVYIYYKNTTSLYFYTKLLHVSAIYPVHIRCTRRPNLELPDCGQDIWPKHVAVWYCKYKNVMLCIINRLKLNHLLLPTDAHNVIPSHSARYTRLTGHNMQP